MERIPKKAKTIKKSKATKKDKKSKKSIPIVFKKRSELKRGPDGIATLNLTTEIERVRTVYRVKGKPDEVYSYEVTTVHWIETETIRKAYQEGYDRINIDNGRIVYDVMKCVKVLNTQHRGDLIEFDETVLEY